MADTFEIVPAQNLSVISTHFVVMSTLRVGVAGSPLFPVFPCS